MSTVTAVPLLPVKKAYVRWIWLGAVLALIAAALLAFQAPGDTAASFLARNKRAAGVVETPSGLQYQVLQKGKGGPTPTDADITLVEYEGRLTSGKQFDKSQQPVPFPLGGGAIPGFEEGLKLMGKGAKYRLWIPPQLGYGDKPVTNPQTGEVAIPAHSVLVFDVTMVDFQSKAFIQQMQMMQQMQQGGRAPR
ncbi:FKBP-type peptidyl-prolyl cis-trans isomerase [Sphingomonas aracearum]|uniref:Peptidyl-prolyl cis-trans isomerase n=1 Tax=Sphingomonas aracearum TaxID=2283317 RepID=A0A369VU04_9SPHN|nr:FKBP-type peptidyl-prolyl cis-trans isomerase [Sphingomonas aracearum]RDE05563.1 FKBP-type peptidyl-prolyl cis-trans isomerase [Sphingomonas aracearum]